MSSPKALPPLHDKLRNIVLEYGTALATNTQRCDAFLSDLLTGHEYAKTLLVQGVANGIPQVFLNKQAAPSVKANIPTTYSHAEHQWLVDTWCYAITGKHTLKQGILSRYHKSIRLTITAVLILLCQPNTEGYPPDHSPEQPIARTPIETIGDSEHSNILQTAIAYRQTQLSIKEALSLSQSLATVKRQLVAKRQGLSSLNDLSTISNDDFYQQEKSTVIRQINRLEKNLQQLSQQYATQLQKLCSIRESEVQTAMHVVLETHQHPTHFEKTSCEALKQQLRQCHTLQGQRAHDLSR